MITRHTDGKLTWVDLESPTQEEVKALIEEFNIDPLVAEELLLPTMRPRVDVHDDFTYLILHFPALRHTHRANEQEVDFIIGRDFLITTRYDTIDPIHKFSKVFEVNSILKQSAIGDHAGYLFFSLLKKLYRAIDHELEHIQSALEDIETKIFQGLEKEMVEALSKSGRDLLNLRQTIEPHRDVLRSLEADGKMFFGDEFTPFLRALSNEYYRVHNHLMRNTAFMQELRETNNSLLYTKQNEVMKILTIMAFVTFPLALFTSLFGMNTEYLPFVGHPLDFWIVIAIMVVLTMVFFGYFKYKKWL